MNELLGLVNHPLAARVGLVLLQFVWQGAALGLVAAGALCALRKGSAISRYAVLLAVLTAMALCPVVTFVAAPRAPVTPSVPTSMTAREWVEMTPPAVVGAQHAVPSGRLSVEGTQPAAPLPPAAPSSPRVSWSACARAWAFAHLAWVGFFWLAGVSVLSLRFLLCGWSLWRLARRLEPAGAEWQERLAALGRRLGQMRSVRLLVSSAASVPAVVGWLRPAIVLPVGAFTGLAPEQLGALLAHELAHLRRHDQWVSLAQTLLELLLFYHPAVWWVSRALRAEREHCCDDAAVSLSGDLAGYMQALAWVEEHRGPGLQPALAASGSPLVTRLRRLAGGPASVEARPPWLPALLALALVGVVLMASAVSHAQTADARGSGLHDQWMPQTEHDPRLQQPVHIEIIGRPATVAMKLLSEKTGVSLGVVPEDLDTVGERKLTIIAQGCSLKALLVQIPRALRECHVDIDTSGKEPAYLLHRNGDELTAMARLAEEEPLRQQAEWRPQREARVEAAREALAMSPAELDELAKTDPLLAAQMKIPEARAQTELFLSLPQKQMEEFLAKGQVSMDFTTAPERFRQAAIEAQQSGLEKIDSETKARDPNLIKLFQFSLAHPEDVTVGYEDPDWTGLTEGTGLVITTYNSKLAGVFNSGPEYRAIPPRLVDARSAKWESQLLVKAGLDQKAADALLAKLVEEHDQEVRERRDEKRAQWREPMGPALHKIVTLPFDQPVEPVEVQKFVAQETGLSLVSDYFTTWGPRKIPDEAKGAQPVWRLLYLLGEKWFWTYDWNEAGDCLVFHDRNWYRRAVSELPESLIRSIRDKLKRQGSLALDDVAAVAVAIDKRIPKSPAFHGLWVDVPRDLWDKGLIPPELTNEALLMYATLSPEQKAKARRAEGLPYAEMTDAQRVLVQRSSTSGNDPRPVPGEQVLQAVYRLQQAVDHGRRMQKLQIVFPRKTVEVWLRLDPAAPPPASGKP